MTIVRDLRGYGRVRPDIVWPNGARVAVSLDARTGRKLWHFQGVHHDIWDRDFPSPPVLVSLMRNGKKIDAVAQTQRVRRKWVDRTARVAGRDAMPQLVEIDDRLPPALDEGQGGE